MKRRLFSFYLILYALIISFLSRKLKMAVTMNFNVGVLGHVDSGKTSLARALSTVASTASFDKNPQSKERGITLDLGFSSFNVEAPAHLKEKNGKLEKLQYTLVDCPGHASLIRTIIGGARIIDMMMLVVDVTKGMQTQTAECLVIGEILCDKMIVVLNKVDMLPEAKQQTAIDRMTKKILKTLENTVFAGSPVIPVSAKPGGPEAPDTGAVGVDVLIDALKSFTYIPERDASGPCIFAVDHCFSIRGQGTVMTGTMLSGTIAVNDTVEIPSMKVQKKVKSMQMFRKPIDKASQGDRLGVCVTQFDPKQLERGLICTPNTLPTILGGIVRVTRIPYFRGSIATKAKFHISVGYETVMGKATFFGCYGDDLNPKATFDFSQDYVYCDELIAANSNSLESEDVKVPTSHYAILELERPVTCAEKSFVIGSKLDTDIHSNVCRLAFHGQLLQTFLDPKYTESVLPQVRVYKDKCKEGIVERKNDDYSVICRGLFKKESKIDAFVGMKVTLSTGEQGSIEGGFGQSGKFKVRIPEGLSDAAQAALASKGKKGKGKGGSDEAGAAAAPTESILLFVHFRRYIYDPDKRMQQT